MGRKKILIKPIECPRLRSVTFYKRRKGLLKKAMELAVLCQSHVFLAFVDNETGKLITFNSHSHNELQNLFSKTPMHLREQFRTEDYSMLYGGGESAMKPKSKRRSTTLRVKEEEDQYELESLAIEERPQRKPKREVKSRSKNAQRSSRSRKNVMRIMEPRASSKYTYQEVKSSSALQDSDEDQDDYFEEESQDKPRYYRSHHHDDAFEAPHHQSSICDIINVFEQEGSEQAEDYHRVQNYRSHHRGSMKGPSSRKLKAKLQLEDLDIGEQNREKKYEEENEDEEVPYKYTKQQSFHFKGKKKQSSQVDRSEGQIQAKKTNIHSSKESQATSHMQQAQQQYMQNPMMYHQFQMGGIPSAGAYPPSMAPVTQQTPTIKDYSPYPMLMTPSPFPRFLVPGFGGPATGQSSQNIGMGFDIPTSGLFPAASPIYSYAGLMQTPVELRSNFASGQPIFKPNGVQQKQSLQNLGQSALSAEKVRKGSEFSFIEGQKNKDDSGSIQPREWYQSLLEMPPQVVNQGNEMSNSQQNLTEHQLVESPKHEQRKGISAQEVVRKGEEQL